MASVDDRVNEWLKDAHAMEQQAEQMLSGMASRTENYPQLRSRIEQHVEETRSQRDRIEACLSARGESPSSIKDIGAKGVALMQAASGLFVGDEVMKGTLASYSFEHFEIGSYKILAAAARAAGDEKTARTCEEICREEEAMAAWLSDHAEELTRAYLTREAAPGLEAKH